MSQNGVVLCNDMKKKPKNEEKQTDDIVFEEEVDSPSGQLKKLRDRLKECSKEKQEYMDGWQRAKADFINFKKEQEEAKKNIIKYAKEGLISEILPTIESFEMAFSNKEAWDKVDKNWRIGVEYIYTQLMTTLENNGVKQVGEVGAKFNPNEYDSVEMLETDKKTDDGNIGYVVQKGYQLNGKIIKPAKVKVFQYKK